MPEILKTEEGLQHITASLNDLWKDMVKKGSQKVKGGCDKPDCIKYSNG